MNQKVEYRGSVFKTDSPSSLFKLNTTRFYLRISIWIKTK